LQCAKYKILKRWKEYINELFTYDRGAKPQSHKQSGLPILEVETVCALKSMAKGKAAGSDGLIVEMLDALAEFRINTIMCLANSIYIIYNEGKFPAEMIKSVFITRPKKQAPPNVNNTEQLA